jgi:tetratricopeptide (TPR) repeat protein
MTETNKCRYCGAELKKGVSLCSACGRELEGRPQGKQRKTKRTGKELIAIVGVLVLFAAIYAVFFAGHQGPDQVLQHPDFSSRPQAEADIDKLLSELPDDYDRLVQQGNDYMDKGVYAMAIVCYEKALTRDSTDPDVMTDLAVCYHASGESQTAIKTLEKALGLSPSHLIAHFNLGIVYRDLNMPEKTRFYWNKLIEFHPDRPLADTARKYIKLLGSR